MWAKAFLDGAERPFKVALERGNGHVSVFSSCLRGEEYAEANLRYMERTVKFLLWSVGGWRVTICGCAETAEKLRSIYCAGGERDFDFNFEFDVFERPFELVLCEERDFPRENEQARSVGGHLKGCRIGFDAGGSDRKVSAVIDGVSVYSEEVVWFPKQSADPSYQYNGIVESFRTAASKMPRVDAIGVSSAGVFVGNSPMVSSLFLKVPRERRAEVKSIYDRAAKEIGDVPIVVANDGDVTALAGAMSLSSGAVMGIAMGTSEAAGYVTPEGKIPGWFNELAFAPVDLQRDAPQDEWSHDFGVGCKYFSQDAVIRLAPRAGIGLPDELSPAEKLKAVQKLAEEGHEGARKILRPALSAGARPRGLGRRRRAADRGVQARPARGISGAGGTGDGHAAGRESPPRGPEHRRGKPAGGLICAFTMLCCFSARRASSTAASTWRTGASPPFSPMSERARSTSAAPA